MESSNQCFFRRRSRDQDEFWVTNINWSMHFLRYLAGRLLLSLNSCRIKRSRTSDDQVIKGDFHWSRFLILVANASTGDMYVTTPWNSISNVIDRPRNQELYWSGLTKSKKLIRILLHPSKCTINPYDCLAKDP